MVFFQTKTFNPEAPEKEPDTLADRVKIKSKSVLDTSSFRKEKKSVFAFIIAGIAQAGLEIPIEYFQEK